MSDTTMPSNEGLIEKLAAIEHEIWANWQQYVHDKSPRQADGSRIIPAWAVDSWEKQMITEYQWLSDKEKARDMKQVDRYWPLIEQAINTAKQTAVAEACYQELKRTMYTVWGPEGNYNRDDVPHELLARLTELEAEMRNVHGSSGRRQLC